jgi:hypothetical protein
VNRQIRADDARDRWLETRRALLEEISVVLSALLEYFAPTSSSVVPIGRSRTAANLLRCYHVRVLHSIGSLWTRSRYRLAALLDAPYYSEVLLALVSSSLFAFLSFDSSLASFLLFSSFTIVEVMHCHASTSQIHSATTNYSNIIHYFSVDFSIHFDACLSLSSAVRKLITSQIALK